MKSPRTSIVLCVLILTSLLTVFNNCGDSTVMNDPLEESSKSLDSSEDLSSTSNPVPEPEDNSGYIPSSMRITADKMEIEKGKKAKLSVVDGAPPYNITVSPNSAGSVSSSNEFKGNSVGVATITVTDSMGATATIALNVTDDDDDDDDDDNDSEVSSFLRRFLGR